MFHSVPTRSSRALRLTLASMVLALAPGAAGAAPGSPPAAGADPAMTIQRAQDLEHRLAIPSVRTASARPLPLAAPRASSGPSGGGLQREVFGFATYWELPSHYQEWNLSLLSTLAYFGLDIHSDGTLDAQDSGATVWNSAAFATLVTNAHAAHDRVVLTVKPYSDSDMYALTCSANATATAVRNIQAAITSKNIDGVNIDFEGQNSSNTCGGNSPQVNFTNFMRALYQGLKTVNASWYVSVDTYSGSADWTGGYFNIGSLAPYTDAFFDMAYDMWSANSSSTAGPNAPLNGWTYNDTSSVTNYLKIIPASQLILGVPYYGYQYCTSGNWDLAPLSGNCGVGAEPYSEGGSAQPCLNVLCDLLASGASVGWDSTAASPWFSWTYGQGNTDPCNSYSAGNCETYYDNPVSLGYKYDLVNQLNLRGTGMWALGYDSGRNDLWQELVSKFVHDTTPPTVGVTQPAAGTTTSFPLSFSGTDYGSGVRTFDIEVLDTAQNQWLPWMAGLAPTGYSGATANGSATFYGFKGHSYEFAVSATDYAGNVSGYGAPTQAVTIPSSATSANSFTGIYTLDGYGGVHGAQSPPVPVSDYWPGWDIARSLAVTADGQGGYVLDGFGGVHNFGDAAGVTQTSDYWQDWDIARDVAILPGGAGGYVLDGYGGIHPFATGGAVLPPPVTLSAYWMGWDIARRMVLLPTGAGGYVLDGWGGVHPFAIGSNPMPAAVRLSAYWYRWNIARGIALIPGGGGAGYVLDGYGGLHAFAPQGTPLPGAPSAGAYWKGWDIARGVVPAPNSSAGNPAGWVLDGYGGMHGYGTASDLQVSAYWQGWQIARDAAGS